MTYKEIVGVLTDRLSDGAHRRERDLMLMGYREEHAGGIATASPRPQYYARFGRDACACRP